MVREAHGGAVDLHFQRVARRLHLRYQARVALLPLLKLGFGEGIRQRQHRHEVAVFAEGGRGLAAHAQGGRVGCAEIGMPGLERL